MKTLRWFLALMLCFSMATTAMACGAPEADESGDDAAQEEGAMDDMEGEDEPSEEEGMEDEAEDEAEAEDDGEASDLGTPDEPIIMSFVPSVEQAEVMTGADQISELLAAETGLTVESNVATSYAAVIEAMGAGNAHVGWLNTFSYILANEKHGVQPILVAERYGSTAYASLIISRADSGIDTMEDLAGTKFCRPDPLSTSGWIIPSVDMKAAGLDPDADVELVDSGNHDAVVTAVYNGDCDAGAVFDDARTGLEEEYPDVMEVIQVIHTSADIPNDNVAVIASLPADIVQKLIDGLMAIAATEEGAAALETAYGIEKFAITSDTFYDAFRTTLDEAGVDVEDLAEE